MSAGNLILNKDYLGWSQKCKKNTDLLLSIFLDKAQKRKNTDALIKLNRFFVSLAQRFEAYIFNIKAT